MLCSSPYSFKTNGTEKKPQNPNQTKTPFQACYHRQPGLKFLGSSSLILWTSYVLGLRLS